jgi:uncharacterized RDD family membrane protein YckC
MLEIVTPEHVAIRYELAGVGTRLAAAAVDAGLKFIAKCVIIGLIFLTSLTGIMSGNAEAEQASVMVVTLTVIFVFFAVDWGYHVAFESLWSGQTPGKRWLGVRVIREGGYPVDFRTVVIRNLMWAVDMLPIVPIAIVPGVWEIPVITYAFGIAAIMLSARHQRLGDMAAGTVVVRHQRERRKQQTFGFGDAQVFRLLDGSTLSALGGMTRHEYDMVRRFLDRRRKLPPMLRVRFAYQLATPLMQKLHYAATTLGMDLERWLEEVELGYRYRTIGAPTQQSAPSATLVRPLTIATAPKTDAPLDGRKW